MTKTTSEKLRDAAIANGLGGDTKRRSHVPSEDIDLLAQDYTSQSQCFYSPIDKKVYPNRQSWTAHLSHFWTTESICQFKLCVSPMSCKYCDANISYKNWHIKADKKVSTYCVSCTESEVWKSKSHRDKFDINTGEAISISKKKFYQTTRGQEVKLSIAEKNSKHRQAFYASEEGQIYRLSYGQHMSAIMSEKVLKGEFTPNVKNTRSKWDAQVIDPNGCAKRFRSSWEACVWLSNPTWEYEKVRIPYKLGDKTKVYIVDFVDEQSKILYEVKPLAFMGQFAVKQTAAQNYCEINGYKFVVLSEENIMNHIDTTKISDNNLKHLDRLRNGINANCRY